MINFRPYKQWKEDLIPRLDGNTSHLTLSVKLWGPGVGVIRLAIPIFAIGEAVGAIIIFSLLQMSHL